MGDSLLFLTSTSASVPTGRNARRKARTDLVRQSGPRGPVHGTYSTISVTSQSYSVTSKRHQEHDSQGQPKSLHKGRQSRETRTSPRQAPARHRQPLRVTSLQLVCVQNLLDEAKLKIRAVLARACEVEPSLFREGLRCRPWAGADFALGMLQFTPQLSSAVAYLEHRLFATNESRSSDVVGLGKYTSALAQLREALRDPDRRALSSTLAASHILALCAMFDFGRSSEWIKLVEGVVVVIKFQSERCDSGSRRHFESHAGPVMIQAFLTRQQQAVLDQSWRRVLGIAGQELLIPPEDAQNFADSAELVMTSLPPRSASGGLQITSSDAETHASLRKAYAIRSHIREMLLRDLNSLAPPPYRCPQRELYDKRLAVVLGLDDYINRLRSNAQDMRILMTDSLMLYQQVIATDLMVGPLREGQRREYA